MGKIYYRSKMKQLMYYFKSLFDGKMSMSLSMPVSPDNGFKTIYMGLTTNEFKKGHIYEYQESQGDALYAFYYAFEGDEWTYYTKSATPSAGDTIYDVTGTATELTVESYDDGSITVDEGSYEVTAARDSTKDVTPTIGTWTDISGSEFATKTELSGKANIATTIAGYGITDAYTKTEVNTALSGKANVSTSLSGYGITDAYTKTQVDNALSGKANVANSLAGYGITNAYTKTETDNLVAGSKSWTLLYDVTKTSTQSRKIGIIRIPDSLDNPSHISITDFISNYKEAKIVISFDMTADVSAPTITKYIAVIDTSDISTDYGYQYIAFPADVSCSGSTIVDGVEFRYENDAILVPTPEGGIIKQLTDYFYFILNGLVRVNEDILTKVSPTAVWDYRVNVKIYAR